jgi:hypothetical protein
LIIKELPSLTTHYF